MSNTTNLVLPYLAVGQAQKHVTVNESLRRLDAIVQLSVASATITTQPASPADGVVYIVPPGKSGAAWSAYANWSLGYYRDGAWEQLSPREGWLAYVKDNDLLLRYDGAAWSQFTAGGALAVSATDRVLGRVSSGAGAAEEVVFTDVAQQLCDDTSFAAMCATLGSWRVIGKTGVLVSHTGDTSEFALATVPIPAGAMGPNGVLRITALFSHSNSANNKTLRVRLGGISGAEFLNVPVASNRTTLIARTIHNRNAQNAQVSLAAATGVSFSSTNQTAATGSIDTSATQDLVITGQLANAGDSVALECCLVEIAYGA